jgi:elongation factor Ts
VAKNEGFVTLTNQIADVALKASPASLEALMALSFDDSMTVAEKLTEQTGVIGEKLEVASYEHLSGEFFASYIHAGNKLATLVSLSSKADEAGRDVAMQAAAMNPVALNRDEVPTEVIDRELEVAREQIRLEGKPEEMIDRIAQGKLNKFFKDNTLIDQSFIKDSKQTVSSYLNSVEKGLAVTGFRRVGLGV